MQVVQVVLVIPVSFADCSGKQILHLCRAGHVGYLVYKCITGIQVIQGHFIFIAQSTTVQVIQAIGSWGGKHNKG